MNQKVTGSNPAQCTTNRHVLRAVGGFSFCLVLLENFPLRGLFQMGRGAGFSVCVYCFFFRPSDR